MKFKIVEAKTQPHHSEYFRGLSYEEQSDVRSRAIDFIELHSTPVFDSRIFRPANNTDMSLTKLSNYDLMLFCMSNRLRYTVLRLKDSGEENTFFAYDPSMYSKVTSVVTPSLV